MKAHSRKISNSLTKPLGYHAVHAEESMGEKESETKYEMRSLMNSSGMQGLGADGKMSRVSLDSEESEELGDRDSGMGMGKI